MSEKIFVIVSTLLLIVVCYCGVRNDTQTSNTAAAHNNVKVVHETVVIYY